jgi:two-component system, chemotaxis family, chemotaxis protein CheY
MNILVVDDEKDVQPLFQQKFRREIRSGDIALHFALSGDEALRYLQTHPLQIVLVLSDINMPGMNGLDLLKNIRVTHKIPPPAVMMVTANGDDDNRRLSLQWGADDFLTKPVDFEALKEKIKILPL